MARLKSVLVAWLEKLACKHEWKYYDEKYGHWSNYSFLAAVKKCFRCGRIKKVKL